MKRVFGGARKWVVVGVLAAGAMTYVLATTAGSATAQTSAKYASITGAAFTPEESSCMFYDRNGYSGEYQEDEGCNFSGGIQLPHNALVTGVWVFYDASEDDAEFHLEENGPFGGHTDIVSLSLNDCGSSNCVVFRQGSHLNSPDINNLHYGYAAWVSPDCCGFKIYRVVVRYVENAGGATPTGLPAGGTSKNP